VDVTEQQRRSWADDALDAARAGTDALFDPNIADAALQAAEEARTRFAEFLDASADRRRQAAGPVLDGQQRASFERALDAWLDWLRTSAEMALQLGGPLLNDLADGGRAGDAVAFARTVAGTEATTTFNINNNTADPLVGVRFHCGDLRSSDESVIPMECVTFDPTEIDLIEPATSYYVTARLVLPEGTAAGTYRGVVMATQLTDQHLPVTVEVVPRVVR
jgi:hypothetical protein